MIFDRGGGKLAQEPAVSLIQLEWGFRVGPEGLEGLEGTKLSKHLKLFKLIFSFLELELITRTKKGKTFYSPWHIATVDKKEYNNGVLRMKYQYVHA